MAGRKLYFFSKRLNIIGSKARTAFRPLHTVSKDSFEPKLNVFECSNGLPRLRGRPFLPGSADEGMPEYLQPVTDDFPFVLTSADFPKSSRGSLSSFASSVKPFIEEKLLRYGALLLRDIGLGTKKDFEVFYNSLGFKSMSYFGGTASRDAVGKNIMEATADPSPFTVEPHNEMSYWTSWPHYFFLFCERPTSAGMGGESSFTKVHDIAASLDPELKAPFYEHQVRYSRHISTQGSTLCHSLNKAFKTSDKSQIEAIISERGHSFRWHDDGSLTYWYAAPAVRKHPVTGEDLWFNQITFEGSFCRSYPGFNEVADSADDKMPFQTYYGDGSVIPQTVIQTIRNVAWGCSVGVKLKQGDLAILDNMLVQHGRLGYVGDRSMVVSLACR